jgi:chromosome segregation ATPase
MKPESWPVAEDAHWKTWKFKEIITEAMEHENLRIRKELASFEEKYSHQERLHKAVLSELESERTHKADQQKALESAYDFIKIRDKEIGNLEKALRSLIRQRDRFKNRLRQFRGPAAPILRDDESGRVILELLF